MHAGSAPGLLGTLRSLADGLMDTARDRLGLLAVELQEEKVRVIRIFVWISVVLFLALLATIFTSLAIVVVWWDTARVAVVVSLAGFYLVGLLVAIVAFRRMLRQEPKPFAATLNELREDQACIRTGN